MGRAPQVRVESKFRYPTFHSQQWQLVNESEKNHLAYASAYSIRAVRVHHYARCNFFVCGPKFITWLKKFGEKIPTSPISPEVIDVHTLNFKPNFKFSRLKIFLGRSPAQLGCALGSLGQSPAHVKISGHSPPKGENTVSRKMRTTVGQYSRQ